MQCAAYLGHHIEPSGQPYTHATRPLISTPGQKNFLYWSSWSLSNPMDYAIICYHIGQPCILLSSWLPTWGIHKSLITEPTPHNELYFTLQSVHTSLWRLICGVWQNCRRRTKGTHPLCPLSCRSTWRLAISKTCRTWPKVILPTPH